MPKYSYTVINKANKQLSGTINAPDEINARKELNDLGFSILSLQTLAEENINSSPLANSENQTIKFQFSATDKNNKKILGTIQALDRYEAYKRLVKEYLFKVETIVENNLSDEQKAQMTLRGVDDLRDRMYEEEIIKDEENKEATKSIEEFTEKQARLKNQVDFVLKKVNEIIETYRNELQPATKEKIRYYLEKILRIKNSTNLDYIRETCEEMLKYLQHEEIFLHEEQRLKEKTTLAVEAKSMMLKLHNTNKKENISFVEKLTKWREEHIINNQNQSIIETIINFLISFIIGFEEDPPSIKNIKLDLKNINTQLKDFLNLYFQAPNQEFKIETSRSLKRLWQERKKTIKALKKAKLDYTNSKYLQGELKFSEKIERETFKLSGIILCFYIVYYFISLYANSKQINIVGVENLRLIFYSSFLKYFFTFLFLFHSLVGIKIHFFQRNHLVNITFPPLLIFLSSLIILNL